MCVGTKDVHELLELCVSIVLVVRVQLYCIMALADPHRKPSGDPIAESSSRM